MQYLTLNNGVRMPILGYGVYQIDPDQCHRCVSDALAVGYRSIDTAQVYQNEEGVGKAVETCGLPRSDLFLTTKVWISNCGYDKTKAAIDVSLNKLKTDYIDLLLIHQPFNDYYGSYRAMVEAYKTGTLRAVGVSNFYPDRLIDFCQFQEVVPAVNQVETHAFQQQRAAHEIMEKYGVQHQSWAPFAEGRKKMFTHTAIKAIADKHGKSVAQVILRFLIQMDVVVIPKTTRKERMIENFSVFDFSLDGEDMVVMAGLDENKSAFFSHYDPETVEFLTNLGKS